MKTLGGHYYEEEELESMGFANIGKNVKIHSRASLYGLENISIADNVRIDDYCVIIATGPLKIGSYVQISNFCWIGSTNGVFIDNFCSLAPRVTILTSSDDYTGKYLTNATVPREYSKGGLRGPVRLNKHVIIGTNTIVLPDVEIGEGGSIGAMSLVNKNLDSWGMYLGNPVRKIADRSKDLLIFEKIII